MHDIAHAAADAARVPHFDDVLKRGRRHRNRRHGLAVGAASLAVASIVGGAQLIGSDESREPQLTPSPGPTTISDSTGISSGSTPVPFWEDGVLHVGAHEIETRLRDTRYAQGTTVVGSAHFERGSEWHLVDGDDLVPVVESDELVRLVVSPDGKVVAWVESTSETVRTLVLWDVPSQQVIDSVAVRVEVTCCDQGGELFIQGVDLDHRVVFSTDRAWVWDPGSDPVEVKGIDQPSLLSDPWPGGLVYQGRAGEPGFRPATGVYGTLDTDGRFHRAGTAPVDQGGIWSPGGTAYVFAGQFSGLKLFHRDSELDLPLPRAGSWDPIAWESETTLIAELRGSQLARCDVVAMACVSLDQRPTLRTTWPDNRAG